VNKIFWESVARILREQQALGARIQPLIKAHDEMGAYSGAN
jgi:hypothetical protein